MNRSNSENNVTAQVFAPLLYSLEGKRLLGEWLTGTKEATVQEGTFFWFPLRDEVANYYYNLEGSWDYGLLFEALGMRQDAIPGLPAGHPKSPSPEWRRARKESFYAEVIAELASTEFDAAFDVNASGRRWLFLVEAKWLSPLGAGLRGLNQVQRSVALALWLKRSFPDREVTYMVCSVKGREADGSLQDQLTDRQWEGMPEDFSLPMHEFAQHLAREVEVCSVNLFSRSWRSLGETIGKEPLLSSVGTFLSDHGQGRKYRGRSAALIGPG